MSSRYFFISSDDKIYELPQDKTVFIGRAPVNHIPLNDSTVSRTHAAVRQQGDDLTITDRNSANGTLVNGQVMPEALLGHGDVVQVGRFIFMVFRGLPEQAREWVQRRTQAFNDKDTEKMVKIQVLRSTAMSGDLTGFSLLDLVETLKEHEKSGCVLLKNRGQQIGTIFFLNGNIVNAETQNGLKGKEAFLVLMNAPLDHFDFQSGTRSPSIAIVERSTKLIEEAQLTKKKPW